MNKYQEALNYLKANCEQWVVNEDYRKNKKILDTTFEESDKSSELLQELVDMYPFFRRLKSKEKPLSPMLNKDKELVCRHCKESSGLYSVYMETDVDYDYEENPYSYYYEVKEKNSYCGNCGQALDWSEDGGE